jgi:hypothetical protein
MNSSFQTKMEINKKNTTIYINNYIKLVYVTISISLFFFFISSNSFEYIMAQNETSKNHNITLNKTNTTSQINNSANTDNGGLLENLPVIDDTLP